VIQARLRSAATLVVLVVVMLTGVAWAWSSVTKPFPEREKAATCVTHPVSKGDKVYPDQVTVSVLNAGTREGLADRTMTDLVTAGLDRGETDNAPDDADVTGAQIWAADGNDPAVKLVISYLGKAAKVVHRDPLLPGVNVIVGDDFSGPVKGRTWVLARESSTVCGPDETLDDL
jgi:hypothetical protein